ncbi:MAG: Mini-ribonuclease 3 [Clostridia bacterium]|nr:Mini-ribonuclease 3 [Clostridia bacterium]
MEEKDVNEMSPLTWAYIGDAVFELFIRENLVKNTKLKPHKLHIESIKHVKASAQAKTLREIEENLTQEEKEIVRRSRNAKNHHLPKNTDVSDYMHSTAFEGLIGYLYLSRKRRKTKGNIKLI